MVPGPQLSSLGVLVFSTNDRSIRLCVPFTECAMVVAWRGIGVSNFGVKKENSEKPTFRLSR